MTCLVLVFHWTVLLYAHAGAARAVVGAAVRANGQDCSQAVWP